MIPKYVWGSGERESYTQQEITKRAHGCKTSHCSNSAFCYVIHVPPLPDCTALPSSTALPTGTPLAALPTCRAKMDVLWYIQDKSKKFVTIIFCTRTFGLHEIFKCAHVKFTVYGHTQLPQMQSR